MYACMGFRCILVEKDTVFYEKVEIVVKSLQLEDLLNQIQKRDPLPPPKLKNGVL